jgi:hypothetical protein
MPATSVVEAVSSLGGFSVAIDVFGSTDAGTTVVSANKASKVSMVVYNPTALPHNHNRPSDPCAQV